MDIKKYEGTLSFNDFSEGLVTYGDCKTFGEVWKKVVGCRRCPYWDTCTEIMNAYEGIKCDQVIDILLGHKKLDDVIKEI